MRHIKDILNESLFKQHITDIGGNLKVYKNTMKSTSWPQKTPERYYVLVDNKELLDNLLSTIPDPSWHIEDSFNDNWSRSDTAEHNVWLRPRLKQTGDHGIHNFYNQKDLNTKYIFVEEINIKDFTADYWIKKYNK